MATPTYWIGLQDDEPRYTMTCGCVLTTDGSAMYHDACDTALFVCPMHEHAEDLLSAVRVTLTSPADGIEQLRAVVARIDAEDKDGESTDEERSQGWMRTFLYRVLENDDEGDPLDFGVVNAVDLDRAKTLVRAHLWDLGVAGWRGGTVPVRFYNCGEATLSEGLPVGTEPNVDVRLKIAKQKS